MIPLVCHGPPLFLVYLILTLIHLSNSSSLSSHSPFLYHCLLSPSSLSSSLPYSHFPPLLSLSPPAFDQTGRIINITVAPINNYDPPRLLNYLTAPHICVWSAACASCAVPGLCDSITLIVKGIRIRFSFDLFLF